MLKGNAAEMKFITSQRGNLCAKYVPRAAKMGKKLKKSSKKQENFSCMHIN